MKFLVDVLELLWQQYKLEIQNKKRWRLNNFVAMIINVKLDLLKRTQAYSDYILLRSDTTTQ